MPSPFNKRQSLAKRISAPHAARPSISGAKLRQKSLWRRTQFVFEWLQPRILLSGTGVASSTAPGFENPAYVLSSSPPSVADPAAAFPSTVFGTTANLSVLGADANGESTLTYNWATIGSPPAPVVFSANGTNASKNTVATFHEAGNYSFLVTITDGNGNSVSSSVSVLVQQTATSIAVSPAGTAVYVDQKQQFSATELDQFGFAMAQQPSFTWDLGSGGGSIDGGGNYTAPAVTGSATVVAYDGAVTGSATVSIQDPGPEITQAAAANPSTVTSTNTQLTIQATDDDGNNTLSYQWSVLSQPNGVIGPTFSVNGDNQANNTTAIFYAPGSYQFQCVVSDPNGATSTSVVTVQVSQTLTSINISPPATMTTRSTQQIAATALDQFGNRMSAPITWSASGGGSVSSSGLFTSSFSTGNENVTAGNGGVHGQATINVVSSPALLAAPATVTGTQTTLTAVGVTGVLASYSWTVTAKPAGATTPTLNVASGGESATATFFQAGNYAFEFQCRSLLGLLGTTTLTVNITVDQTLTTILVTPSSATMNLSGAEQFMATAYDQFGKSMAQPPYQWAVTSGGGNISGGGNYTPPAQSTVATITATSGAVSGSATVTVTNAAPTVSHAASYSPNNPTAPGQVNLQVQGADDGGQPNLTYTWSVVGTAPGPVGFSVNGTNNAQNTTANIITPGTYNFLATITDADGSFVTSAVSVTLAAAPNSAPTFSVPAAQQTPENTPLTFSAGNGNLITMTNTPNGQIQVTLAATNGVLNLGSTSGISFNGGTANGEATLNFQGNAAAVNAALNGLIFTPTPGDYGYAGIELSASAGPQTSLYYAIPISIAPVASPPTVATPAAASPNPVTGTTTNLSVLGADQAGESTLTYSWSVLSKPAGALNPSFSLNGSNGAQNTVATFGSAGNYTLQVTITDPSGLSVTSSVSVVVDQTITSISISPADTAVAVGATQQYSAVALDQFGNAMAIQPTIAWSANAGSINPAGLYTAPASPTTDTVSAGSGGVIGFTTVAVVSAGTAVASPGVVTATNTTLSVLGGATSGVIYTWSAITLPTGASSPSFSANNSSAAQTTIATFSHAGDYTFQVAINNGSITYQTVSVIVQQTVTSISVSPATASLDENAQQQFSAAAHDQFGNAIASPGPFVWTVFSGGGAIDGTGLYTAPGAGGVGTVTISADIGAVSGSASITVIDAPPVVAAAAAASSSPVTTTSTLLSVLGSDDGGEANLTYTWTTTGTPPAPVEFSLNGNNAAKNTIASFTSAGTYHFLVTISDVGGLTATSAVTVVVNQTLTALTITPGSTAMFQHAQKQFTVSAADQFGNAIAAPAVTWAVQSGEGSINSSGLYSSATPPGVATIAAISGSVRATADVTIDNAAPTVADAAISPSTVNGTFTNLSVLGADDAGESNLRYTWSTTGTPPAAVIFSANGTNVAKNTIATFSASGTYQFLVTIVDAEGASATSSVTVEVIPTFSAIVVSPAGSALQRAQSEQFSAIAVDQFGAPMATQPSFNWSTLANVGTISAAGLYTAPDAGAGNATIIATAGNISGSATTALLDGLSVSVPAGQSTVPGLPLIFSTNNSISISDADAATQSVPLTLTLSATGGLISLSEVNGLTLDSGTGANDATVTLTGSLAAINASLQGLKFTPDPDFAGDATLSVTINEVSVSPDSPTRTVSIYVGDAATTTTSNSSGPFAQTTSSDSDSSTIANILNGSLISTSNPTTTSSQTTSTNPSNVFAQDPINASYTISSDDTASASGQASSPVTPAPAPTDPGANPAPKMAAVARAVTSRQPSAPAHSASNSPPAPASSIPDKQVETVPDQVFTFLDPQSPMLKNLDEIKTDMASQKALKVTAGSATVVSFSASAAYLVWMLRGGSLLSSLLSVFPAWKSMDPIPVLDSFEKSRKKQKYQDGDNDSLESLVENSNQDAQSSSAAKSSDTADTEPTP